jgi:hypothetical protein
MLHTKAGERKVVVEYSKHTHGLIVEPTLRRTVFPGNAALSVELTHYGGKSLRGNSGVREQ